jgi:predicted phage gp36 major capsid-like protein
VTITYDDYVDLEHSIDPYYRAAAKWMMHDDMLKVSRKIKQQPASDLRSWLRARQPRRRPRSPAGPRDRTEPAHGVAGANAKSLLCGDFSKYLIRDVMDVTLFRMTDSAFTLKGQVGFVAFCRSGANMVDVGGAIKYYQNSAT